MRRLHEIPYQQRLTAVVAGGVVVSGIAAVWASVETTVALSTLTNLIWVLGGCRGGKFEIVHRTVEVLSEIVWEPSKKE